MIWHFRYFNHGFKFQDSICNGCHDLAMLFANISDIAIITDKNVDYLCIIHNIESNSFIKKFSAKKSWICIKISS